MRTTLLKSPVLVIAVMLLSCQARPQDNYEIQVYPSETVQPHQTIVELHSNFTAEGRKTTNDGLLPTEHAFHETLEITHGFTSWFEIGYYNFTSLRSGDGWDWVGTHIRPKVSVPEERHWPLGLSISNEIGYQRRTFSVDTWTWEIRPIIDRRQGPWYFSFNPTIDRAIKGESEDKGFEFSPNFKVSYDATRKISTGVEYYGALGPIIGFDPLPDQQHQILPAIDLNVSPKWESILE